MIHGWGVDSKVYERVIQRILLHITRVQSQGKQKMSLATYQRVEVEQHVSFPWCLRLRPRAALDVYPLSEQ